MFPPFMSVPPMESSVRIAEARRPSGVGVRDWATWLAVGAIAGGIPVLADAAGLPVRYALYGSSALALAGLLPFMVARTGSFERLLWIIFVLSLQLEVAWAPVYWGYQKMAGPYGILISPTLLIGVLLAGMWVVARLWGVRPFKPLKGTGFYPAALCFLGAALISFVATPDHTLSAFGLFEILSLMVTTVVAAHACSTRSGLIVLTVTLFAILFIQSVFIFAEQTLGVQISLAHGINSDYGWAEGSAGRFAGTFAAPSVVATFLAVCLLFAFGRLFSRRPSRHSAWLGFLFGIGFCALLLTRTRSAWIAFAIGVLGLGWRSYRDGTISRRMCVRLAGLAFLALLAAWPLVASRLTEDHEEAASVRGNLVTIAAAMIASHPLTGVGINTATNQVYNYAAQAGVSGWVFIVHNQFLLVACETGLPGLAAFLLVIGVGLRAAYRCMYATDVMVQETGAVVFWSLIALIWALNLDHVSGCKTYFLLWFLIGAACGLYALSRREELGQGATVS